MRFNVNHKVRVRLTDEGRRLLIEKRKRLNEILRASQAVPHEDMPFVEVDGWSEWQLWQLMAHFGEHIGMGVGLLFETDIELDAIPENPINKDELIEHLEIGRDHEQRDKDRGLESISPTANARYEKDCQDRIDNFNKLIAQIRGFDGAYLDGAGAFA